MTKAQDMIQKGIETGDMELVKEGYALLEQKPKKKTVKKKTVKKRGKSPKKVLTQPTVDNILTDEEPKKDPHDFSFQIRQKNIKQQNQEGRRAPRVEQVDFTDRVNTFRDDNTLVPVKESDKKLYIAPPVPRREEVDIREVACIECNKVFNVNAKLIKHKQFMCNECLKNHAAKLKKGIK